MAIIRRIQRSLTGTGGWADVDTVAEAVDEYSDTGLLSDTTYHYRVRTENGGVYSPWSNVDSATTDAAGDPYFSDVTLLILSEGADGSTSFTDSSSLAHTITRFGNTQVETANPPLSGAQSALFDGTGGYLTTPYVTADFNWWTEDYTVEAWVRATSWAGWSNSNNAPNLIGNGDPSGLTQYNGFGVDASSGYVKFYYWNGAQNFITGVNPLSASTWRHIAMTQTGGTIRLFAHGVLTASAAVSGTPQSSTGYPLVIGKIRDGGINGQVYGPRITKGVARYTANFTPPSEPFPDN